VTITSGQLVTVGTHCVVIYSMVMYAVRCGQGRYLRRCVLGRVMTVGFMIDCGPFSELLPGGVALILKLDDGVGEVSKIAGMPTALNPGWKDSGLGTTHGGTRSEETRGNTAINNVVCENGNMFANASVERLEAC
jgi:hypothetical protein